MPRPDVTAARRQQILDAAASVFATKGFAGARMDDLVAQSGLSKGTLYWYFDSKDDIILAILERFFDHEMEGLDALAASDLPPGQQLQQLCRQVTVDMEAMAAFLPLSFEFYAAAGRSDKIRQFLRRYFRRYRERLAAVIEAGIAAGDFKPLPADDVALALIAQFEGLALLWTVDPAGVVPSAHGEALLHLLLGGLER